MLARQTDSWGMERRREMPKGRGLKAMLRGLLDFILRTTERGSAGCSAESKARGAELSKANGAGGRLEVCGQAGPHHQTTEGCTRAAMCAGREYQT